MRSSLFWFWTVFSACTGQRDEAGTAGAPAEAPPAQTRPPDIVLVVVDTLRADHLGLYGHERPTSPNLDALAARGVWFSRAYAQSGWTLPSFTSLFTGLLPHEHRVGRDPFDPKRYGRLPQERVTLAELLSQAGYATGAIANNTFLAPEFALNQGFSNYNWVGAANNEHRSASETVTLGMDWLKEQQSPSFLLLHFMEPHADYAPAPDVRGTFAPVADPPVTVPFSPNAEQWILWHAGRDAPSAEIQDYVRRLYDEEILSVDKAIGALVAQLDAEKRWDHTALIVTADHGEELWDHGGFEHGHTLYGELTRVPLVAAGKVRGSGEVKTVVQHVDLFQGILALAGVPQPPGTHGADLFSIAAAGPYASPRLAVSENILYGPEQIAIVDDHYRLDINLMANFGEVWRVDARGLEGERLQGEEQAREGERLSQALARVRGSLLPVQAVEGPEVPSVEVFQQLRALGYVEGDLPEPEAPSPEAPSPSAPAPSAP